MKGPRSNVSAFAISYPRVDALESEDGALRLYRRRGLFGLLRRQDIFHPAGEWESVTLDRDGTAVVAIARKQR